MPSKKTLSKHGLRTWIEIDTKALANNYRLFKKHVGKGPLVMAIAKSNAYGHYLVEYAKEMEMLGADWIGVDSLVEGLTLRKEGITVPILVLGYTLPEKFEEAAESDISLAVSSFESLSALQKRKLNLKIHIKVDTGMHRQGFLPEQIPKLLREIAHLPTSVVLEGVFTHLAAKDPSIMRSNKEQIRVFETVREQFVAAGHAPLFHAAATWGTLVYPDAHYDMVRLGIGLFGYFPSGATKREFEKRLPLRPALSWKTVLSEIKQLPEGGGIGYDLTEELPPGAKIGICPIGYWHGYPRALSSVGFVLVCGKRARVLGRVSMDMIAVDLSLVPKAKTGDEVVLIGRQGKETIDALEVASWMGASHYELLTRINPLIKRIYF
ncbi:MAG: alanine racemase [Patescibacteria group bacterium]